MKNIIILFLLVLLSACDRPAFLDVPRNTGINSLDSLQTFIDNGIGDGYFPSQIVSSNPSIQSRLEDINIKFRTIIQWDSRSTCPQHEDQIVLALSTENQSVQCGFGDTVILLGQGNDWVDDSWGNDIIYPGAGDDIINTGNGNDIVIFDENWGHDTLTMHSQKLEKENLLEYDGSYPWEFTSFIVFGKGISREDIVWKNDSLVHLKTGDSIKLNTKKINILFASDTKQKRADLSFIPEYREPEIIQLEKLNAEGVLVQDNMAYYAKGNDGLYIIDLTRLAAPTVLSKLVLPGRAMSVRIKNDLAFVSQADSNLEGKLGWVSIIDIKDPRTPQILNTINFGSNVYDVAVDKRYLYVPETHFQAKEWNLHIYDIVKPQKPKLVSTTPLSAHSRYIAYLNETVYLSMHTSGIQVFDVTNPNKPRQTARYGLGKKWVRSLKLSDGKIIVNQDNNTFIVLNPTRDKKLETLCRATTQEHEKWDITPGVDSIQIRDNMIFRAEGKQGVTVWDVTDWKNCHLAAQIPIEDQWVGSVYIIKNTLIAFNDQKKSTLYNLNEIFPDYKVEEPAPLPAAESDEVVKEESEPNPLAELSQDQLQTLLYAAASNNDAEQVTILCGKGAEPNETGHDPHNPIEISAMLGKLHSLQALLECPGAKPTGKSMMRAALNEEIHAMKLLEQYGGNIAQTDSDGCTILHYLAQDGTLEMVKYLVSQGAPVDAQCRGGQTALKWAHFGENKEVIGYLESF